MSNLDPMAELTRLASLKEQGAVTDEEFETTKQALLAQIGHEPTLPPTVDIPPAGGSRGSAGRGLRIAVGIMALLLSLPLLLQSCAVGVLSSATGAESEAGAGAVGVLIALLVMIGGAFAFGLPKVSVVVFAIAAALGFMASATSGFTDLGMWSVVAVILAVMSFVAVRRSRA